MMMLHACIDNNASNHVICEASSTAFLAAVISSVDLRASSASHSSYNRKREHVGSSVGQRRALLTVESPHHMLLW